MVEVLEIIMKRLRMKISGQNRAVQARKAQGRTQAEVDTLVADTLYMTLV
jgi:hypothetical protein